MLNRAIRRTLKPQALQASRNADADSYRRLRLIRYEGPNLNVASHNDERRQQYKEEFSFWTSFNIGNEGYSHCHVVDDVDPVRGHRNEWYWLAIILLGLPILATGRKYNEEQVAASVGHANNRYAKMDLDDESAAINCAVPAKRAGWM